MSEWTIERGEGRSDSERGEKSKLRREKGLTEMVVFVVFFARLFYHIESGRADCMCVPMQDRRGGAD